MRLKGHFWKTMFYLKYHVQWSTTKMCNKETETKIRKLYFYYYMFASNTAVYA